MIQRWSSGLPADAVGWFSMSRLPADHPWVTVRLSRRRTADLRAASYGFFSANYTPNSHWSPSRGRQATGWRPAGRRPTELICVTSADHPANFNCELNLPGRRRTSARWGLCRWITAGFLLDLMQNLPYGGRAADFSVLGRQLNWSNWLMDK